MARTEQERILIAEKAETIREKAKKYSISAYEIGQNTILSLSGAKKILEGTSKTPSEENLAVIEKYIQQAYEGAPMGVVKNVIEEPKAEYKDYNNLNVDEKLNLILNKLESLEVMQKAIDLKQSIIFEITKLAKAEELKIYEEEFAARFNSMQKQH